MDDETYHACVSLLLRIEGELLKTLDAVKANKVG